VIVADASALVLALGDEGAPLLARAWGLRDSVGACDAQYVALAELLEAPLVTADRRLARAPGLRCPVDLLR